MARKMVQSGSKRVVVSAAISVPILGRVAAGGVEVPPLNQGTGKGCGPQTPVLGAWVRLAGPLALGLGPGLAVAAAAESGVASGGRGVPWRRVERGTAGL